MPRRDEMQEAYERDYSYEGVLRRTREALAELVQERQLPPKVKADVEALNGVLKKQMDHIVARWN